VGTKVLLAEKDGADIPSDPVFSPATKKQYEVYATSNKILRLRNITLKPKGIKSDNDAMAEDPEPEIHPKHVSDCSEGIKRR